VTLANKEIEIEKAARIGMYHYGQKWILFTRDKASRDYTLKMNGHIGRMCIER